MYLLQCKCHASLFGSKKNNETENGKERYRIKLVCKSWKYHWTNNEVFQEGLLQLIWINPQETAVGIGKK